MTLTTAQLDRACGALLGTAAGDALGAPYEFGPPRGPELEVAMVGGGSFGWGPVNSVAAYLPEGQPASHAHTRARSAGRRRFAKWLRAGRP